MAQKNAKVFLCTEALEHAQMYLARFVKDERLKILTALNDAGEVTLADELTEALRAWDKASQELLDLS